MKKYVMFDFICSQSYHWNLVVMKFTFWLETNTPLGLNFFYCATLFIIAGMIETWHTWESGETSCVCELWQCEIGKLSYGSNQRPLYFQNGFY